MSEILNRLQVGLLISIATTGGLIFYGRVAKISDGVVELAPCELRNADGGVFIDKKHVHIVAEQIVAAWPP